jgi:hypothetical protein
MENKQLTALGRIALKHLKEHRPMLFAHIEKQELLNDIVWELQEMAKKTLEGLRKQGVPHTEAWEIATSRYIYLPSEEEQPVLESWRYPFSQPDIEGASATEVTDYEELE